MIRPRALWILFMTMGSVLAACTGSAEPASPRGSIASAAPGQTATPSPELSRLRVSTRGWKTDFTKASVDLGSFVGGGPPKDGIPAIDDPKYESIADARRWLSDRSPVISLEINGAARAYPLAILMWHEIVNDTLGGKPVVVTFCPLCNTALVFEREVDGVVHDFGTTGNLRYSDLVMYDRQTESWWQQATGEALVGVLSGQELVFLPAQIISVAEFGHAFQDGDVLSRETGFSRVYGRNPYGGYDSIDQNPLQYEEEQAGPLGPKERVVTVGEGADAVAIPYSELRTVGVAILSAGSEELVVFWTPGAASALDSGIIDNSRDVGATGVFRPVVDGRRLTFERPGGENAPIRDRETGSTWSIAGIAVTGKLQGSRLEPVVHGDHFWFAWAVFSPETTIWTARYGETRPPSS